MDSNGADTRGRLSLDLIALSSLTPPSPALSPTPLATAFSWSEIHIELDFSLDGVETSPTPSSSAFGASELGLGILPRRCSVNSVGTVGTFGIFGNSQDFEELRYSPLLETAVAETLLRSSHTITTLGDSNTSDETDALDHSPKNRVRDENGWLLDGLSDRSHIPPSPTIIIHLNAEPLISENVTLSTASSHDSLALVSYSPLLEPSESRPGARSSTVSIGDDSPVNALIRHMAFEAALARLEYNPAATRSLMCSNCSLPNSLTWLSDVTVEILIDQEGFRAVLACFKYSGYLSAGSKANKHGFETAQFRPISRQVFDFHYAPLEGLPALRRISANGDESRDYISRQASLGLKANGVYFVRGTEALSFPVPRAESERETKGDASKLQWRFEYLVDDKKGEIGKKSIDGEKTLTPLTFSCSPLLLHPLQGKKVRLMQVFKKTVIAKISAEKMEPPGLPSKDHHTFLPLKTTGAHLSPTPHGPGPVWNAHKRTVTQFVPPPDRGRPPMSPLGDTPLQAGARPTRRRRASSAGERNRPGTSPLSSYVHLASRGNSPLLCQNIIPRSRLAAMLDAEVDKREPFLPPAIVPPIQTDVPSFHPLTPCPRRHQLVAQ
ncbi:hypothetical protein DXG03_008472 [Asterophora parasitica]|uniref:Uncharacterized protein n=1 Tax=Asterophora parasitica TaxID=117018 RepID=A0A9P7GDU1_9AGAR|nr:hypothetical protein DXG03_008472 [Asterophora parasitica]